MMEKSNSQYDSFLFWRQPIPALDLSELEDLGLTDSQPANSIKGKDKSSSLRGQDEEVRGQPGAENTISSLHCKTSTNTYVDKHVSDVNKH